MTDPAERLAEAARAHNEKCDAHPGGTVDAALAAFDADAPRRKAEQAVVQAAKALTDAPAAWPIDAQMKVCAAVRALRDIEQ